MNGENLSFLEFCAVYKNSPLPLLSQTKKEPTELYDLFYGNIFLSADVEEYYAILRTPNSTYKCRSVFHHSINLWEISHSAWIE